MNKELDEQLETEVVTSIKELGWKVIGHDVNGLNTAHECIAQAQLDFEVSKMPLKVSLPNGLLTTVDESYATVRTDTYQILGIVGERYTISQNNEVFSFFDKIVESKIAHYDTCGILGNGSRVFLIAKFNKSIELTKNDKVDLYLIMNNSHDTFSSLSASILPVYNNNSISVSTLKSGKSNNRIIVRHTKNLDTNGLDEKVLNMISHYIPLLTKSLQLLAHTKADENVYEKIIVHALADTPKMEQDYFKNKASTRFKGIVEKCMEYAFKNESQLNEATNHTLFGAVNAVVGFYQNQKDWDDEYKLKQFWEDNNRLAIKIQNAYDMALSFVNIENNLKITTKKVK